MSLLDFECQKCYFQDENGQKYCDICPTGILENQKTHTWKFKMPSIYDLGIKGVNE